MKSGMVVRGGIWDQCCGSQSPVYPGADRPLLLLGVGGQGPCSMLPSGHSCTGQKGEDSPGSVKPVCFPVNTESREELEERRTSLGVQVRLFKMKAFPTGILDEERILACLYWFV